MYASDPFYPLVNFYQTILIYLENPSMALGSQKKELSSLDETERKYMIQVIKNKLADIFEFLEISFP